VSVESTARPAIRAGLRLQWEPMQDCHVLLYAEGMVKLNRSAGEILSRCDGALTTAEIVADLERAFSRTELTGDVLNFLAHAQQQGWIEVRT
jgi:pyrroloquinoline quinone biosynthesis protein D